MEIEIYADVLFCLNYLMDLQIIFLTDLLSRNRVRIGRISIAAALLALYGTIVFCPEISFLGAGAGRAAVSALAVWIFCPGISLKKFLKTYVVFWLTAFGLGGTVTALAMYAESGRALRAVSVNGGIYLDMGLGTLVLGIAISYGVFLSFRRSCIRNFSRERVLVKLNIEPGEGIGAFSVTGLLDTGCELTVPVTGDGIVLIPKEVFCGGIPECPFSVSIRTAGGVGRLPAFYPRKISCEDSRYCLTGTPAVAITENQFTEDGLYQAVINPEIFQENKIGGKDNEVESQNPCGSTAAGMDGKTGTGTGEKCFLHRGRGKSAAASESGGGSGASDTAGQSRNTAVGTANLN